MDKELGEFVGKGFAMLRDRLKAVEAQKATAAFVDYEQIRSMIPEPVPGKDAVVDYEQIRLMIPDPVPGKDAVVDYVKIKAMIPAPIAGADAVVDYEKIRLMIPDPVKGDDGVVDYDKIEAMIPDPVPGKDAVVDYEKIRDMIPPPKKPKDGEDGNGIDTLEINSRGHLIVTFDDGSKKDVGKVRGRDGDSGGGGSLRPQPASEILAGLIALGTQAEVDAGTVANKAVTPKTLRDSNVARVFIGDVDIAIGETTLVHGLNLSNKNAYTVSAKINNSSVNLDVDSVDVNTIKLTSLVAATGVSITVIGA
jgi:hypothetical protein